MYRHLGKNHKAQAECSNLGRGTYRRRSSALLANRCAKCGTDNPQSKMLCADCGNRRQAPKRPDARLIQSNGPTEKGLDWTYGENGEILSLMDRRKVFGASAKFAVRAREYQEVMAEWERKRQAGETITIFRSEADEIRARLKVTDELWNQIQMLYEQSSKVGKKTQATKSDDRLFGRGVALLERLNDLQRANIRQFRTFLARPAPKAKN